jgi:hypothetical protein
MASTDALPLPRKNVAFRLYFTVRTSAGVLVTAFTSPDSEVSKDGGAYADCTNEATYVGRGTGYIDLTSTEMNADNVAFYFSCTEGEIESPVVIYPAEDADIKTNSIMQNGTALTARDIGASVIAASISTGGITTGSFASGAINSGAIGQTALDAMTANTLNASRSSYQSAGTIGEGISFMLAYMGTWTGTGVNTVLGAFKALLSKTASTPSDIGGTFSAATDSTEAIRDNMGTAQTGDAYARLGTPAAASVSADIAAVKAETATIVGQTGTTGVLLADSEDVYPADIQFTRDDVNNKDEYTVLWFRNGTPVTSGITVPLIQVIKRADGTDLVASTAMTQIGSSGAYKYDESTAANRIDDGEAVVVAVSATINGSSRTWRKTITRDQTS